MKKSVKDFYIRLAKGIAAQFGPDCEVVLHDLKSKDHDHSIIAIENGHVSGRKVGDGPSKIVLEALNDPGRPLEDKLAYLTRTGDGKLLKSSTLYIRDNNENVIGIFGINYDISTMLAIREQLHTLTASATEQEDSEPVSLNIESILDDLIENSMKLINKPVSIMTKEDKIKFVKNLNDAGAFLITKSGTKICDYLGISKYTLYSYLNEIKAAEEDQ